ncbi:hypothetical protein [Fonticella tunisiensis]|uniref:Uncharacterized protein n=1 Tax=Fonticella tunisiensis TaxID=1096341 RepID=A0A4R7KDI0_9CLOT|nr:hypothetical protein [Fonticella tunisiensis]TDT50919.1 hypothetical protein EDD71_12314 [Fonticella tunisiensis]
MEERNIQSTAPGDDNISIIENVNIQVVQDTMSKIQQFQALVQKNLKQNHDYGIIPGSNKPTLLKPGAEKILMLLGLTSEYELIERVHDYEKGFFAFTIRAKLYRGQQLITEGVGHCNTREKKYRYHDPYTLANTCLKMAKKRALVDATLTVASLSDVFTQDLEDIDIASVEEDKSEAEDIEDEETITRAQAKRLYAISNGNVDLIKKVMERYGYKRSDEIKKIHYDKIAAEIENELNQVIKEGDYRGASIRH